MNILIAAFAIVFVLKVAEEIFHAPPLVPRLMAQIDRRSSGSYTNAFGFPLICVLSAYAITAAVGSLTVGIGPAVNDLATACGIMFFFGMVCCWVSFAGDVAARTRQLYTGKAPNASAPIQRTTSFLFFFGVYGSLGLVACKLLSDAGMLTL